jgi:DNA-binding CsgD family transcriptional regulator
MIAIAIQDGNTHFCHGIRILIDRASQKMNIPYVILPAEHADIARLLFISITRFRQYRKQWYLPCLPQHQQLVIISSRRETSGLVPYPCSSFPPRLYREESVETVSRKIGNWLLCTHLGQCLIPTTSCHRCPTHHLSPFEKRFLSLLINNYSLIRTAAILRMDNVRARALYQSIIQKLDSRSREQLRHCIRSL